MPTGVPMTDAHGRLLDAALRVLLRDGADALTSRAVTAEARVAKGILHRRFPDFDTFLAALVLARLDLLDARSAELRAAAGTGTVEDNLADALIAALDQDALAVVSLVLSRRGLLARLRLATPAGIPLLAETTKMIAAYLTAERGLGRIAIDVDVDRLALFLVGAAHLLCAGSESASSDADEIRELVTTAIAGAVSEGIAGTVSEVSERGIEPSRRGRR